ncbi:MAG TPA: helix-turn-helix domain-containing protein [Bacteroidales bacterium]|nr:helix-turn-helix domain-containing protein [Bacteroidales bacterium]
MKIPETNMISSELKARKELISPPGDTIQETIDYIGMSQAELATRMGRPKEKLNDIIKGREPISISAAIKLERVLGIAASFWINREQEYREELARIEEEQSLLKEVSWLQNFPVSDLKKMGVLPSTSNETELVRSLLNFFGIATVSQWNDIYIGKNITAAFRISLANTNNPHSIASWLRLGEINVSKQKLPDYDEKGFKETLNTLKKTVKDHPSDFMETLQRSCFDCGVGIVFTKCLHKAPISGATRWIYGKPLIQLSDRYKTNNHFWFSYYHEAGHILLHGKKEVFLEDIEGAIIDKVKEEQADKFAESHLFPLASMKNLLTDGITRSNIIKYAKKLKTHPAIIVGQLQHYGHLGYNKMNDFKVKYSLPCQS